MATKLDKTKPYGIVRGQQSGPVQLAFYQNGHYFDPKGEYVDLNPAPVKEPEPEVPVVVEEPVTEPKPKVKVNKPKVQLPPGLPTKE